MSLTLAAVLALAAQCAPTVAPDTIASIAQTESGLNELAVHDNTAVRSFQPASRDEAVALATDLIVAQRHSVDLGLMQVNSANLVFLGLSIPDAFDACRSIAGGAKVLSDAYQKALRSALSAYNTGDMQRGITNGYVGRVERASISVPSLQPTVPPSAPAPDVPPPSAVGWDVHAQSSGPQFVFLSSNK